MKHDDIPGVFAHIDVDGFRLEEFEDDQEEENQDTLGPTRYVEAVAGSNFTVGVTFNADFLYPNEDINCRVWLDGKDVTGRLSRKSRTILHTLECDGVMESNQNGTFLRKFQFSYLKTNDGAVKAELKEDLKDLGSISIRLIRCVSRPAAKVFNSSGSFKPVGGDSVPEKGLKGRAISSRATLGAMEKVKTSFVDVEYPYGTHPFAVFTFKYRSHKDLQIEGIISRSPSPLPLEQRDPATLNADELRQLLDRRNQELQDLAHVKREKRERSTTLIDDDDDDDDDEVTVTERRSKCPRTSQDSGIEVVDLTDD